MQKEGAQKGWFKDQLGNEFTTKDGKPPSVYGVSTTNANGTGQLGNGTWSGGVSQTDKSK